MLRSCRSFRPIPVPAPPQELETIEPLPIPFYMQGNDSKLPSGFMEPTRIFEQTLNTVLPQQEGNYSSVKDIDSRYVDLRSDWITPHFFPTHNLPVARLRVIQDTDTGEYHISGGTIALPGTGLEVGYGATPGGEGREAVIQWKKSF